MVCIDSFSCWIAESFFNAAGLVADLSLAGDLRAKRYPRLLWLVPLVLISAWLSCALGSGVRGATTSVSIQSPGLYRAIATDIVGWLVLGFGVVWIRASMPTRKQEAS